ncbi:MAG TPA: M28 family peptidase [Candidatus Polarisedimenticolia bacterium]|nr:M28 family peptidase [Candidatus Polarisedimenticolia bacterium]
MRRILAVAIVAAVAAGALGGLAAVEGAPAKAVRTFDLLELLLETPGVSGHEGPVREAIVGLLPSWAREASRVDEKGNLLVAAGQGGKRLLFVAHMDEIGYEIASIEPDGTARVRSRGGFFNTLFEGHAVVVKTKSGDRQATVRPREDYLAGTVEGGALVDTKVIVDFGTGAAPETEALGVAPGDPLTIPKKFRRLAGEMGSGRSVDDRAGCTALVEAVRRLDPRRLKNRIIFAWSVEEEIGLLGAEAIARESSFEVVFAVDTFVSSDSPLERKGFALGVLGRGPVVRAIDNSNLAPPLLVDRVHRIAMGRGIPLQVGLTRGGNDGSVFTPFGAADVPISWPTIYSHSPVEVVHEGDLRNLGRLVAALAESW